MSGRRKKGEPMTLGELRDRIGASVWLLIAYCGMADTGREASDENLAELLKAPYGVETIARWREALVREGIVAVARGLDGGVSCYHLHRHLALVHSWDGTERGVC